MLSSRGIIQKVIRSHPSHKMLTQQHRNVSKFTVMFGLAVAVVVYFNQGAILKSIKDVVSESTSMSKNNVKR